MTKWADYLISAVAYDSERQIISLKRHRDTGDSIDSGEIIDKATVASDIDKGMSYMTIFSTLSNWKLGEKIRSSRVDNQYCLRIDDNKVKHDNLGSLPELPNVLKDEIPKTSTKKISSEITSQISPQDKALLKNMGAQYHTSIKSIEAKPETTSMPKLSDSKNEIKSKDRLAEYEKSYLERIDTQNKIISEPEVLESPHGTLPKGFDESTPQETHPEPTTKEPEPEVLESPHGTLPKEQYIATKKDDKSKPVYDEQSKELNNLEKQIGELKKAVDELDESKNPSTSSTNENSTEIQAYCVKCKSKRIVKNPIQSELKNGRPAIKGTCSVCETRMCRIGKLK